MSVLIHTQAALTRRTDIVADPTGHRRLPLFVLNVDLCVVDASGHLSITQRYIIELGIII